MSFVELGSGARYRVGIAGLDVRGVKMLMAVVKQGHFQESFKETGSGFDIDFDGQRSRSFPQIGYVAGNPAHVNFPILHQLTLSVSEPKSKILKTSRNNNKS
jgi:hypothetical protein